MRLRHQQADLLFFFILSLWKMKLEALHHTVGDAEELLGVEGLCFVFFKVPRCEAFYGWERVVVFFYDDFIVTYPYAEFSASITEANMQTVCVCVCSILLSASEHCDSFITGEVQAVVT